MEYKFIHLEKTHIVKLEKDGGAYKITIDGKTYGISDCTRHLDVVTFVLGGKLFNVYYVEEKAIIYLTVDGDYYVLEAAQGSVTKGRGAVLQKGDSVSSPMPGLVVKIPVDIGEEVKAGTTLAIVEAMKMQNELRSPRDGIVEKIYFKEGEQVDALQAIVELKISEDE